MDAKSAYIQTGSACKMYIVNCAERKGVKRMYTESRKTEIAFLKKLWRGEKVDCPKCGEAVLTHLHRKTKKSDCDWKCPSCGEVYRTINMLKQLQKE